MGPLDTLLAPRSVAIIGASPDPHRIRGQLLPLLRDNGFTGRIILVNPSYTAIDGLPCVPTLAAADLSPIDVALVAIPADRVLPALEECAAAGVRYAVVISSGFAEDEAAPAELQGRVAELARRTGMRVLGPNGEGFHNDVARVSATFSPAINRAADTNPTAVAARIGIIAQSGGIGFALYNRGRGLGLSFSSVVSTGNEADLTAADILAHMADDSDTAGMVLFIESVRDPAGFAAAARLARDAGKPIVAIRVGRSVAGKRAAASHTASMIGWEAGYDAFFARHGIVVAEELDEALVLAAALVGPAACGPRVAVVTVSGGAGAWAADLLEAEGLALPELSAATQQEIRSFIPSYGAARNPVDLTAGGAAGGGTLRTIELLTRDPGVDQVVVVTTLANPARVAFDGPALAALLGERRKPVLFYSYTMPSPLSRQVLAEAGAFIFPSVASLARTARALHQRPATRPAPAAFNLPDAARAALSGGPKSFTEHGAKTILAACGVAMPAGRLVRRREELDAAAAALGFPLAAKIQSAAIPHKTEIGGVRLNLPDRAALAAAFDELLAAAARHAPEAEVDGVLVERMAPPGVEMIVAVVRDPDFGPVVSVGAGGVMTELVRDVAYRLAPLDAAEAAAALRSLRSAPLLTGFRGAPPADVAALAELVALISRIAVAGRADIAELELNPVIVHPEGQGCTVADALMVLAPAGHEGA